VSGEIALLGLNESIYPLVIRHISSLSRPLEDVPLSSTHRGVSVRRDRGHQAAFRARRKDRSQLAGCSLLRPIANQDGGEATSRGHCVESTSLN
jgi:hypothetical protein